MAGPQRLTMTLTPITSAYNAYVARCGRKETASMSNDHMPSMDMHAHPAHLQPDPAPDTPGFHGMLLFGEGTAYLSHLPMFMPPHNYQAFFEVTLTKAGSDPFADYVKDRSETQTRMYAFAPSGPPFVLTDLVAGTATPPQLNSFPGTIWRGHFEEGHFEPKGTPMLENVIAQVTNVIYFQKLALPATTETTLEYLLLGKVDELYMAHVISGPPDFDQVLHVAVTGHTFTAAELQHGVKVTTGNTNAAEHKLVEFEHFLAPGEAHSAGSDGSPTIPIELRAGGECYFETSDLLPMQ